MKYYPNFWQGFFILLLLIMSDTVDKSLDKIYNKSLSLVDLNGATKFI